MSDDANTTTLTSAELDANRKRVLESLRIDLEETFGQDLILKQLPFLAGYLSDDRLDAMIFQEVRGEMPRVAAAVAAVLSTVGADKLDALYQRLRDVYAPLVVDLWVPPEE